MPYVKSEWTDDFDKYREVVSQHLKKFILHHMGRRVRRRRAP